MSGERDTMLPTSDGRQTALLNWAIENTNLEESKSPGRERELMKDLKEIGPEWYDALFGKSDTEIMRGMINKINDSTASHEDIIHALEQLNYLVELTHNANDFPKLGGFEVIDRMIQRTDQEDYRFYAAWIIGKSAANNPEFQEKLLQQGTILPQLISMISSDPVMKVRAKALHAISALVRSAPAPTLSKFLHDYHGLDAIVKVVHEETDRNMKARAIFFVEYLLSEDSSSYCSEYLLQTNLVSDILSLLGERDYDMREKCLICLVELRKIGGDFFRVVMNSLNASNILEVVYADEVAAEKEEGEDHSELLELISRLLHE